MKLEHLLLEKTKAEVYAFYIDMRTPMKDYEEFYQRLLEEGVHFVRGKVAEVTDAARWPAEKGKLIVQVEDTLVGKQRRIPVDMVVLMGGAGAAGRRQGTGPEVRHLVQHGRLVHRAAPEARPGGHDDRRRVRGRRVPGPEGHSGLGGPGRRGRRPRAGHDHQGRGDDRADRGLDQRRGLLRLPHLQQHVPVQRHRVRRGEERQPRDHARCARAAARAWPPARPASITGAHFNNEQIFAEIDGILWDAKPQAEAEAGNAYRVAVAVRETHRDVAERLTHPDDYDRISH